MIAGKLYNMMETVNIQEKNGVINIIHHHYYCNQNETKSSAKTIHWFKVLKLVGDICKNLLWPNIAFVFDNGTSSTFLTS